jgi:hypothetical protein
VEVERTHLIEQVAEEIHGPIFSAPPGMAVDPMCLPMMPMEGEWTTPLPDDLFDVPTTIVPPGGARFEAPVIVPSTPGAPSSGPAPNDDSSSPVLPAPTEVLPQDPGSARVKPKRSWLKPVGLRSNR